MSQAPSQAQSPAARSSTINWSNANKSTVQNGIKNGLLQLFPKKGRDLHPIWKHFKLIGVDAKSIIPTFVAHIHCQKVLTFKSAHGYTHLQRHNDSCKQMDPKQRTLLDMQKSKKEVPIPMHLRKGIIRSILEFCIADYRPFAVIDGDGFVQLANKLIEVGDKYGGLKWEPYPYGIKPHATTIAKNVKEKEENVRNEQARFFCELMEDSIPSINFTTDLATDNLKRRSFMKNSFFAENLPEKM